MSNTSRRHSRYVSSRMGKSGKRAATVSKSAARRRCSQSGDRRPGWRRGSSSARAAFSRKRAANSAVEPSSRTTISSTSSGSGSSNSAAAVRWLPADERRCRRRTTSYRPRPTVPCAAGRPPPSPRVRGRGHRTATGWRSASLRPRPRNSPRQSSVSLGASPVLSDLVVQILQQIPGGTVIQAVLLDRVVPGLLGGHGATVASQPTDGPTELQRPTGTVASPEGHLARLARCRSDQHAIRA